jgi:lysophospholipase L1-like esterase
MKRMTVISLLRSEFAVFLLCSVCAPGAVVGPGGYANSFSTQPPSADWAMLNIAGDPVDIYNPDTEVNASITAGVVTAQTISDTGNPPNANAMAMWSSTGLYLQTRPTGNRATVLMGKFVNQTGSNVTQIAVSYRLMIAAMGAVEESGRGTRAYFSLSGLLNSWTNVPSLNSTLNMDGNFGFAANVVLNWTNGGSLLLAWLDDNSGDGTDSANQYDNFSLRVTGGTPTNFFCGVSAPIAGRTFVSGSSVIASALTGNGTAPYTVEYFTNSGVGNTTFASVGTMATSPYSLNLGLLPVGDYQIYAVSTDSAGSPQSITSITNSFSVADPIAFALVAPTNGSTIAYTNSVLGVTTVAGGSVPHSVQFYLDGVPVPPITSPPYEHDFGFLPVGNHTVRASVTDAKGWVSNSVLNTIYIDGPIAASLTPSNGTIIGFGTSLALTAAVAGGQSPYAVEFYVNEQLVGSVSSPPFRWNVGTLPAGNYACYVRAKDGSTPPQQTTSTTNLITVLPRLRVLPLGDSITLGLGAPGGYRAPLYHLLLSAGYAPDLLGTMTANGAPTLPDPNHEGWGGYMIDNIDSIMPMVFSSVPQPDVVLLLLGVNDFRNNIDTANAANRLEALVVRIANNWPNSKILVASLTAVAEPLNTQIQMMYNALLPGMCERQRSLGRQVYFTDMYSAVLLADMPDQLHPNQLGYNKMATNWVASIIAAIETNDGAYAFNAEADTYVRDGPFAATSFGNQTVFSISTGTDNRESLLRFGLTNVFAEVLEAKLRLRPVTVTGSATHSLAVVPDNTWTETNTVWNNRPTSGPTMAIWDVPNGLPVEFDVTEAVQAAHTNDGRISFVVSAPSDAPLVSYASREAWPLYSPRLLLRVNNTPPTISSITNQTMERNNVLTVPFTVGDAETPLNLLQLSASSSNPNLIPNTNLIFSGADSQRFLQITPTSNYLGGAVIFVKVHDGLQSATVNFLLTVDGTNFAPTSVSFINPPNNAIYDPPANITFMASASDPDGNLARVDYYLENGLFAMAFSPPYAVTLNTVPAGTYDWRCVATDAGGLSVTSALRRVTVRQGPISLIATGAIWRYFDTNGMDLGTAWRATNYDDSTWRAGASKLGFGDPATTMVDSTPTRVTTYFRTRFTLANPAAITNLTFGVMRDDGAVVYLNGTEVFRTGMNPGTVLNSTLASNAISGAEETTWFTNTTASPSLLVAGTNVVAVEVHQGSTSSSDLGFNLLLVAGAAPFSSPVTLSRQRVGNNLMFSWPAGSGWNLYATPALKADAQWIRIMTGITTMNSQSFYTAPTTSPAQFFRLCQP